VNPGTGAGALPLNNTADLATYNARLNAIYKFDSSSFIDPTTNAAILAGVGTFSYSFSGFNGSNYRSISLVYTPIPEPATIGLVAFGMLAGIGVVRRFRSGKPAISVVS